MLETYLDSEAAAGMADALERGRIVHFPKAPFTLPCAEDLNFLRDELPRRIKLKNVSYHPEAGRITGFKGASELRSRTEQILVEHAERVGAFLRERMPALTRDWTVGTTSFRPMEEQGRDLKPHASNELVHVDAGAYGATHGDRILRFFVNVNPDSDRVWATRGTFRELHARFGKSAGVPSAETQGDLLKKGLGDHVRSGILRGLARAGLPLARVLDSSPYDRAMRRFHNYMKDNQEFRAATDGYQEFRFAPGAAWAVLTDAVSHACLSGQHAFVSTFLLRLEHCRHPETAPYHVLGGSSQETGS